jgi:C4-dicarboxylate-specific signal transduction histidine kinase
MIGAALFEDGGDEGVAFVLDLTERKQAELALSKSQAELTRASRVVALGALTASIAHEVNQPISGIMTNASTCLRLLDANPPNLDAARATAERTLRDGGRAAEIIRRLRDMFAHKTRTTERLDLNDATRELLKLAAAELQRRGVSLRTDFHKGLPTIIGDRIQLQQVVLNLVINAADAMKTVR